MAVLFRALGILLGIVLLITVIRAVIGVFTQALTGGAPAKPKTAATPQPQQLKRDPVCGTFVAVSTGFQKQKGNEMFYFCSAECRDRFLV